MNTQKGTLLIRGLVMVLVALGAQAAQRFEVGSAKADITPTEPIRLSGYGNRTKPSEGVTLRIWTKAIAIRQDEGEVALLVNVENCGISEEIRNEVAASLQEERKVRPEAITIFSTHTHSAPCLKGTLGNIFGAPLKQDEQEVVNRYTAELKERMKEVCRRAIEDLKPARLYWAEGMAGFARNRRTQSGPVDHSLPLLLAKDEGGKIRALLANYACHCTTLTGEFNTVHGDWAGMAQQEIEKANPAALAMVAIGCGADSNPAPRSNPDYAVAYGTEIAREVQRLLATPLTELTGKLTCRSKYIQLPFDPLPTREQWQERAKQPGIVGYHARVNLERLDRGEKIPTELGYLVQAWNFGDQLAMISLPGEVVIDFALRIKNEFDRNRVWVNGYANYVPCYIPSERILREGGYEAESSLWYYDRPTRLSLKTESLIMDAVHQIIPKSFAAE